MAKREYSLNDLHAMAEGLNPFDDEIPQSDPCIKCGKKINAETPIQIGEPMICDYCMDAMNTV